MEKYLEMIQDVVKRMATNSFMLKGWAVTLVAGIFALSAKDTNKIFFIVAYIPIILFWFLDSYYLQLELSRANKKCIISPNKKCRYSARRG